MTRRTRQQNDCPAPSGACSHPTICESHGCAALEVRRNKEKHAATQAVCPSCGGRKYSSGFVDGSAPNGREFGYYTDRLPCSTCDGAGIVTAQMLEWLRIGTRHRKARVDRQESIRQCADRLGISPADISSMEHGRLDPSGLRSEGPDLPGHTAVNDDKP